MNIFFWSELTSLNVDNGIGANCMLLFFFKKREAYVQTLKSSIKTKSHIRVGAKTSSFRVP
jgi:hypothetical protein